MRKLEIKVRGQSPYRTNAQIACLRTIFQGPVVSVRGETEPSSAEKSDHLCCPGVIETEVWTGVCKNVVSSFLEEGAA